MHIIVRSNSLASAVICARGKRTEQTFRINSLGPESGREIPRSYKQLWIRRVLV